MVLRGRESIVMEPVDMEIVRRSVERRVDLPLPVRPHMTRCCPGRIFRVMFFRAKEVELMKVSDR
jgi:hypothetical protein